MLSYNTGVCRQRDELVALLNGRERRCFEMLSLVGHNDESVDSNRLNTHGSDSANSSDITALKVCRLFSDCKLLSLSKYVVPHYR